MAATKTVATCYVCVLAPSATCASEALNYRPFGGLPIRDILTQAVERVRRDCGVLGEPLFNHYDVFEDFFYGQVLTRESAEGLRDVPYAIVDCGVFDCEPSAVVEVQKALLAFHQSGKMLYHIARAHSCPKVFLPGPVISSDEHLTNHFEANLWPRQFSELMAKHVDRH